MIRILCADLASADADRYGEVYGRLYEKASEERKRRADRYLRFEDKLRCVRRTHCFGGPWDRITSEPKRIRTVSHVLQTPKISTTIFPIRGAMWSSLGETETWGWTYSNTARR